MAFNPQPSTWLGPGYAVDVVNHLIKLNTNSAGSNKLLAQLLDAQADPTTGDIRQIAFALLEALYQAWVAQSVAVPANLPGRMIISRAMSGIPTNTTSLTNALITYNVQFQVGPTAGADTIVAE